MPEVAILEAFAELPGSRRNSGQRHTQALCLALFTPAIALWQQGIPSYRRLVKSL